MVINNKFKIRKIKNYYGLIIVCLLIYSCNNKLKQVKLGNYLPSTIKIDSSQLLINPRCNIVTSYIYNLNGIEYRVSLNSENKINFISSFDKKLVIEDGVKVGSLFENLKNKKIEYQKGWGYYTKVTPDWFAYMSFKEEPSDTAKVKSLFKYLDFPEKKDSLEFDLTKNRLNMN